MKLFFKDINKELQKPLDEVLSDLDIQIDETGYIVYSKPVDEGLKVEKKGTEINICYSKIPEFFRGISLLIEQLKEENDFCIEEKSKFDILGFMADNSRNAVLNQKTIKEFIRTLAYMGYNTFMLYTEDTYEMPKYPYFGYQRGRFTKEELKEADQYAKMFGIELVPCIQTLAHLNAVFRWWNMSYLNDVEDILLCKSEDTYIFIEDMIRTCSECYTSKKINIGMDEAHMVGLGKYLDRYGYHERYEIMIEHLNRVIEICKKYNFEPMMWSDMFFRILSKDKDYYDTKIQIPGHFKEQIPREVTLLYWDYYHEKTEIYETMFDNHFKMSDKVAFAGGIWRWEGFAPMLLKSFQMSRAALDACVKKKVKQVLVTGWGDNGSESSMFSILPGLQLYAEYCYSDDVSDERINKRCMTCAKVNVEDFKKLDLLNLTPDNPAPGRIAVTINKYLLYQDILLGLYDKHVEKETFAKHYEEAFNIISEAAKRNEKHQYIFDHLANIAHVLALKCDIGIRLKEAYDKKDRSALDKMLKDDLPQIKERVEKAHKSARVQWEKENKPFGFEVMDIRFGGLLARVDSAIYRVNQYLTGEIDRIEELEGERLFADGRTEEGGSLGMWSNNWTKIVTPSVL